MKRPQVVIGAALLMGGVLLSGAAGTSRSAADVGRDRAAPATAELRAAVTSTAGTGATVLLVQCEAPAEDGAGITISAATASRHPVTAAPGAPGTATVDDLTPGSVCTVTQPDATTLRSVRGGTPVHDPAGALTGVRATITGGVTAVGLVDDFSGGAAPTAP
ncbi:MAG: hypothetical protein KJ056_07450 [Acidimicrobiia bacterium]|nr:hypothetical protein [Acidimicrobiia bacterium]